MGEPTEGELFLRFEQLTVLAMDIAGFAQKQRATRFDFKLAWLARPLVRRCRQRRFALSRADIQWVMRRAAEELDSRAPRP
ncbi:hypothetical protein ACG02S_25895 [Roseateles sp. DC23W]|uniref:Uncharacterized protein n=1 Tax=Pelomonas dachongensis TaxID=3299029 RepID=A0ABW7EV01_9BURK